ncbi:Predicted restriction endonuclease [Alteromonadaceae bacterium Bs31]|nr:Predicted restriction endonuclease [Alteromonadaceae bacterium Bs31]
MNEILINRVIEAIDSKAGVIIKGSQDPTGDRDGLVFWFENYSRGSGPIFSIKPTGLKRLKVTLKFGAYSRDCVDHINTTKNEEAFQLLTHFIGELSKKHDVSNEGANDLDDLNIKTDFKIEIVSKVSDQKSPEDTMEIVLDILPMLVGGMAELIGYEDTDYLEDSAIEGNEKIGIYKRRERNKRNRLLCLQIHGYKCKVCGFETSDNYHDLQRDILEVHHVEPLSELEAARDYDPKRDLIPLCPNCHRAIHSTTPAMKPKDLARKLN